MPLGAGANASVNSENNSANQNNSRSQPPVFARQFGNQNFSSSPALQGRNGKDEAQNNFVGDGQGPLLSKAGFQVSNTPVINPLVRQSNPQPSLVERGLMFITGSNNSHANSAFATPLFNPGIAPHPPQYVGNNTASSSSYLPQILEESNNYPGREPGLEEYFSQSPKGLSPQPLSGNSTPGFMPAYDNKSNNIMEKNKHKSKGNENRPNAPDPDKRYHPAPKILEGFPDAIRVDGKTPKLGGGERRRWELPDGKILEWDYQHGTVEQYDQLGKNHLGEFDSKTGTKINPAIPGRNIKSYL